MQSCVGGVGSTVSISAGSNKSFDVIDIGVSKLMSVLQEEFK